MLGLSYVTTIALAAAFIVAPVAAYREGEGFRDLRHHHKNHLDDIAPHHRGRYEAFPRKKRFVNPQCRELVQQAMHYADEIDRKTMVQDPDMYGAFAKDLSDMHRLKCTLSNEQLLDSLNRAAKSVAKQFHPIHKPPIDCETYLALQWLAENDKGRQDRQAMKNLVDDIRIKIDVHLCRN
ncbi:hypothetical protein FRB96_004010 [Tulasnella sp. 330]|nr:hypothetical protein FRB96_004010 [Tulasnella sp. 330]KAG8872741.1 hypothetical protein FRB97_007395 [Tulasnella sp. 331]KAG8880553.1 hypothetical protein FRB98_005009 [Tulasnella sp. 332]